ncbi:hypothetical protein KSS87_023383 [Heliosperma pusillum]|nr:hypothetical protein KSS87_023383 [Heliosperma pusillum]
MSLSFFITHCLQCNCLCEECVFLASLHIVCIVTPHMKNEFSLLHYPFVLILTSCVINESSLLHYPLLYCNSLCEQ